MTEEAALLARLQASAHARGDVPRFELVRFARADAFERQSSVNIATNRLLRWGEVGERSDRVILRPYTVWQRALIVGVEPSDSSQMDWTRFRLAGWGADDG